MMLHLEMLQSGDDLWQRLRRDGWQIESMTARMALATHPQVATESDARQRLCTLGLLTSRRLRIEFPYAHSRFVPANAANVHPDHN